MEIKITQEIKLNFVRFNMLFIFRNFFLLCDSINFLAEILKIEECNDDLIEDETNGIMFGNLIHSEVIV